MKTDFLTPEGFRIRLCKSQNLDLAEIWLPSGQRKRIRLGRNLKDPSTHFKNFIDRRLPSIIAEYTDLPADPEGDPPLRKIIDHYVDVHLIARRAADSTITLANQVLYEFQRFASSRHIGRASQLTPGLIDQWLASLNGLAAKTLKTRTIMLRACINAAVHAGLLDQSPIKRWIMPKCQDPEIWPLTESQLQELLRLIHTRRPEIAPIISWIALTGQRPSDAVSLRWRQIDLPNRVVSRPQVKVKKLATFEISAAAALLLEQQRPKSAEANPPAKPPDSSTSHSALRTSHDLVFLDPNSNPFTTDRLYNAFVRALPGFQRPVNLKDLRHTFCSLAANEWAIPLPQVQVLAGHSDIRMTMRYVRPSSSRIALDKAQTHLLPATSKPQPDILNKPAPTGSIPEKPNKSPKKI